jgi:histidinol-phosphate aminotransferase
MSLVERVRPDLAGFVPYASARRAGHQAPVRLDANEAPSPAASDGAGLNRYPSPQPPALLAGLAGLYGVDRDQVWVGRGSDEAIDLLVRGFCRAGLDNVVSLAPTFGMYAIAARLQGAQFRTVPVSGGNGFSLDAGALLAATDADTKIVVLCSPNNPTGTLYHHLVAALATALAGRALLLVDEAYIEFADDASAANLLGRHPNLAVLRTLSKAHALAGARVGCLLAAPEIVRLVGAIAAPYPLPAPSVQAALSALSDQALEDTRLRVAAIRAERARLAPLLAARPGIDQVWPSAGNFLLLQCADSAASFRNLLAAGVLVRDVSAHAGLAGCLRVSIGLRAENDRLLQALGLERAA